MKGSPDPELLRTKKEELALLEHQSEQNAIDLYYGDETGVNESGYVPYGWQFKDEKVGIKVIHGKQINCFGILSRDNKLVFQTTTQSINSDFIISFMEKFSFEIKKKTVIILDNARIHTAHKIKERLKVWQNRGLYIFYLPPYSPHLNIIERLWKELKARWLKPEDYITFDDLKYRLYCCLSNVGTNLKINYSKYY